MASKTVAALRQEGNQLFESGKFAEAAGVFRSAVSRFQSDRRSDKAVVDEFVKVAGNLCVCHHAMDDWNTCVSTARELLAIYPIIPKAYAAIGMCIVSRLRQQEAEQQNEDLLNSPNIPPRSGEEVRRDARRYLVKLGGVLCTPDDAHTYLCRAILLSDAQLQVALGPYLETAVRWVSEELLSAGLSLEREYGDGVLGELSALEFSLGDVPALLDTAPVLSEQQSVRVLDANSLALGEGAAAGQRVEELPAVEAEAILRTIREGQLLAHGEESEAGASDSAAAVRQVGPPREPIDFFLSRKPIPVHVCHAERGGIPRGLTLARASGPFAVAQHLQLPLPTDLEPLPVGAAAGVGVDGADGSMAAPMVSLLGGVHLEEEVRHVDPSVDGVTVAGGGGGGVHASSISHAAVAMDTLSSTPESPPLLACNACGAEVNPLTLAGLPPTGCSTCNGVVYCSAACAAAYRPRHERYECALRVVLQARVAALAAAAIAAEQSFTQEEAPLPAGEVVPGAGWDSLDLHRRVLPLCVTVYSGLQSRAAESAAVRARVGLGAQRRLVHCLPSDVADTFTQWIESGHCSELASNTTSDESNGTCEDHEGATGTAAAATITGLPTSTLDGYGESTFDGTSSSSSLSAMELLHAIFFMVRQHGEDHPESRSSSFYAARLLLRHSCEPNCVWSDTLHGILTARYICKGEELTMAVVDHFPQHWPWQIRQKWFVHHHGVPCQCARCLREGADLNDARGTLSNALVEQLLTGDILDHPCPTPAHQHPTHLFHRQVQRLVEQSKSRHCNIPALLRNIDELRAQLRECVLPSHYLLEDLRRALINVAEREGQTATVTSEGQESLFFWEALWSGAVPAKRLQIRVLPSLFECGRRRRIPPTQQRRRRRTSAVAGAGAPPNPTRQEEGAAGGTNATASPSPPPPLDGRRGSGARTPPPFNTRLSGSDGDDDASKARSAAAEAAAVAAQSTPPRTAQPPPLIATKDFSCGRNVVDLFYGSYQTWYM
ncbi:hypothetical protein ABB37_01526 [Leptomonas pyrrhocoris]|uniref:MYND-type domain-containing protein n=1 Tax=Leptomonas pyrrhocoris TaxID=157538 RepID=A0A0M9G8Y4_LEPPY|nr:hypothetical protein ABB37_01526 [Leptomonas pyrrhocoris]XP_015663586.1 hypothetical protein ABB37_01526 [Leptomonas pyrrhocoris]KPA85146.1 hypothetical protein ABB37_01526 [Leptomonas pyrrhocoris]KPA85147.1 hypothetical protein ABB37_01526 [Leptomonas pyrrhocoris]|eukprot:XP_015663585.1 hypothetical protein ABB37_01526 [Leptomonas pyrrhocoris]